MNDQTPVDNGAAPPAAAPATDARPEPLLLKLWRGPCWLLTRMRGRWRGGMWVTAVFGALIAMGELDRLSARVLDKSGLSWSFSKLMGPNSFLIDEAGWNSAPVDRFAGALGIWLGWYLVLDVVFIALYVALGVSIWRKPRAGSREAKLWRATSVALWIVAGLDLVEDLLAFVTQRPALDGGWATAVLWASRLKWVAVLGLIVASVWAARASLAVPAARVRLRAGRRSVFTQRFSLLFVVLAGVLSLTPGAEILDQLPDVERGWVDVGRAPELMYAIGAGGILATLFFVLGRFRSDHVASRIPRNRREPADPELSNLWTWFGVWVFFAGLGIIGQWTGWGDLLWNNFAWFGGVPLAIALISQIIRGLRNGLKSGRLAQHARKLTWKEKGEFSATNLHWTILVGDVAAVAILAIGGLGVVRSFTAPVALAALGPEFARGNQVLALVSGAILAVGVWPLLGALIDRLPSKSALARLLTPGAKPATPRWLKVTCAVGFPALTLVLASNPALLGGIGIVATASATLALISLTLGSVATLAQDRHPPEVFWIPGLRVKSAPVFTLLVAVMLVVSLSSPVAAVHSVRSKGPVDSPVPERPDVATAFATWEKATKGCGRLETIDGLSFRIRVMPMLAAEGGGIRAAYWTSTGVDLLSGRAEFAEDTDGATLTDREIDWCRVAFFSGGASGGAVGLTVSRFADAVPGHEQVISMARSSALAKATMGTLVRDILYGASGVPLPSGVPGWQDRAALIEEAWVADMGGEQSALATNFLPAVYEQAVKSPTGYLILNSASASTGCRVFVSQVKIPAFGDTEGAVIRCDYAVDPDGDPRVADSIDFFRYFGASARGADAGVTQRRDGCTGNLQAATAAVLAARFPYVTPSGVVGPCGIGAEDQLIDGGYIENSGIATITDLAPTWLELVRRHNGASLAAAGADTIDLIVPMVVYFDNDTNSDLTVAPPGATLEGLVPIMGYLRGNPAMNRGTTLLQRAQAVVDPSNLWEVSSSNSDAARRAVRHVRPKGVIVVNQAITPTVTAPLGWSMSGQSIESMNRALYGQFSSSCIHPEGEEAGNTSLVCQRGYGSLADAIAAFGVQRPVG